MSRVDLRHGDCLVILPTLPDNSVDAIVCDSPYELGFMGKTWDSTGISYNVNMWRECLRVLKPGGHLLAFGGSRTYHRMAVAIEDAGFEVRDQIMWLYGSGFPKSHNLEGQWDGWGTALKPAHEPICVARKPLAENTVAENVLMWGTGAVNVDGCRVATGGKKWETPRGGIWATDSNAKSELIDNPQGRWPANVIHDGSAEVLDVFPYTEGHGNSKGYKVYDGSRTGKNYLEGGEDSRYLFQGLKIKLYKPQYNGSGSAARFFYCAKASKADRDEGLDGFTVIAHQSGMGGAMPVDDDGNDRDRFKAQSRNHHPTVKPTSLMRYLCRLVTPPGGVILDPFMGSGSTGKGAVLEGFSFIGIEREAEYLAIARARIAHAADYELLEEDTAWPDGLESVQVTRAEARAPVRPLQQSLF